MQTKPEIYHCVSLKNQMSNKFLIFVFQDICGRRFKWKTLIKSHIKYRHLLGQKFYCEKCPGKEWLYQVSLDHHIKITHQGVSFPCHLCDRVYYSKQGLKFHIAFHDAGYKAEGKRSQLRPESTYQKAREYKLRRKMKMLALKK